MEVIDIGLSDLEPISIQIDDKPSTSVIGSGIELLMNDKRRNTGQTSVSMEDLDKLESDLNDLSSRSSVPHGTTPASSSGGGFGLFDSTSKTLSGLGNMFGLGGSSGSGAKDASRGDEGYEHSSSSTRLGSATAESVGNNRTWDGFTKLQDIPDNKYEEAPSAAKLSEREKRRKKRLMLKKLEEWRDKGLISGSSHFNMDSSYEEIEDEYETALDDKRKKTVSNSKGGGL